MPRTLKALGLPLLNGKLAFLFNQTPCTDVEPLLGFAPVVENDLLKYFTTFFVHEVIQFDKINLCPCDAGIFGGVRSCAWPK